MFEETAAAATDRRVPVAHVVVCLFTAVLALGPAQARAQGPPAGLPGVPVVLDGELDVLYEDGEAEARLVHFLDDGNRRIPLKFEGSFAPDLMTGSRVRVRGNLANDGVTATSVEVVATPTSTTGAKKVLVILINFSNNATQPWPLTTVESVNAQVRNFYLENSYGLTSLSFTVAGWYTIAATDATCDHYTWSTQAEAAATKAGVSLSAYDRLVFAFPKASACSWIGMGNLGGSRSWINGTYTLKNVAHEQGHNFGNHHSKALKCASSSCSTVEYGDDRDVLGKASVVGHMNAFQKERLGWLNYGTTPAIQTVTSSGDYWIGSYVTQSGHPNALRIWNPSQNHYYYVESRAQVGFDANVAAGVTLHSGISGISYQVDLDPVTTTYDSTLDVGQVFTDSKIGLSIETLSTSADGALIRVNVGSAPCSTQPPGVSLAASGAMKYTVTLKNNNGSTCAASLVTATAAVPSGWTASFSPAASASLAPGASASMTLTLTAPAATTGVYSFTVTGKDGSSGKSGSVTGSVTLATSLNVTASASYLGGTGSRRSASIVVVAKAGTQAAAGAAINVVVTSPKGVRSTLAATAGADGRATLRMSLKAKDPAGVYQVAATASSNGATGQASTSFVVQ
jgi:hypothetical protein